MNARLRGRIAYALQDAFSRINGAHEIHENGAHVEIYSGTGKHGFLRQREVVQSNGGDINTLQP